MERDGPLNEDSNLFHITEFNVSENVDPVEVKKLLIGVPDIIFTHMHVTPDIVSISPAPLPHEKSKLEQVQEGLAEIAYRETSRRVMLRYSAVIIMRIPMSRSLRSVRSSLILQWKEEMKATPIRNSI